LCIIKEMKKLPELFCDKGTILRLKKNMIVRENGDSKKLPAGSIWIVEDIIGYGYDLYSSDNNEFYIRVLNSKMNEYFTIID